ncbi:MAG: hypothetical protein ACKVW3_12805 [Phycisphaerales bacterium]
MRGRKELVCGVVAAVAGQARAQENITYALTWSEVVAGSNVPVPMPNGMIEPGEGVRIAIRATITPGIGSTAMYTPPPPPGTGTIAGFGSLSLDLLSSNANGGLWSNITRNAEANPGGIPGGGNWTLGTGGFGDANGSVSGVQAGQFVLPGMTAHAANPVQSVWRGTWTPSSYSLRSASFQSVVQLGTHNHSSILIQYGVDPSGSPLYVGKFIAATFGNTGPIPIVPGPGVVAVVGMGVILGTWRRRETRR